VVKGRPSALQKIRPFIIPEITSLDIVRQSPAPSSPPLLGLNGATRLSIVGWRDFKKTLRFVAFPVVYQLRFLLGLFLVVSGCAWLALRTANRSEIWRARTRQAYNRNKSRLDTAARPITGTVSCMANCRDDDADVLKRTQLAAELRLTPDNAHLT